MSPCVDDICPSFLTICRSDNSIEFSKTVPHRHTYQETRPQILLTPSQSICVQGRCRVSATHSRSPENRTSNSAAPKPDRKSSLEQFPRAHHVSRVRRTK